MNIRALVSYSSFWVIRYSIKISCIGMLESCSIYYRILYNFNSLIL